MEYVVLRMPHCSRECLIVQDYDSIEAKYFNRNSRVQWSEWHEWWYNAKGQRIDPDRWRLWGLWQENQCSAYAEQLRSTPWVQTILRKMRCLPRAFDLWAAPDPPESDVQSPGFHMKKRVQAKKRPRLRAVNKFAAKPEAKPEVKLQPAKRKRAEAEAEVAPEETSSSSRGAAAAEAEVAPEETAEAEVAPEKTSSSSSSAAAPSVPHQAKVPKGSVGLELAWSSSSAAAVSSVQRDSIPWPCRQCMQMPWRCKCHSAADKTLEHIQQEYELVCKRAGVWETAEAQQSDADQQAAQPEPPQEHPPGDLWACPRCSTHNTRHNLVCCVAGCGQRRELTQTWRKDKGDWICPECQNHNYGCRRWCNWTACPTNDWRCRCGNLDRSNRKVCNRFVCQLPRPFNYD